MAPSPTKKVNLESLIAKEELLKLEAIRVKKILKPKERIGEEAAGDVFLFKFEDGNIRAGKRPNINLINKSEKEEGRMKKCLSYVLDELFILHQLSHERIIKFFGFYLDQHQMLMFMEDIRSSVKNEVDKRGCLSEMAAMHYFTQAVEGLAYLHSRTPQAIIHRDIKCQNLLLTAENNIKLADFGLAVDLAISSGSVSTLPTDPAPFAGKCYFAAPEVLKNVYLPEAYVAESDVWSDLLCELRNYFAHRYHLFRSLACTLVEMISGRPPYANLSFIEFTQRSSTASHNPLKYSGDVLPAASSEIKWLLNCIFIPDSKLRPNAQLVLNLAYDVIDKAAKQGDATAQYNLALMYMSGRGVNRSDKEAFKWCSSAAEQGHLSAQFNLGFMYNYGQGVALSYSEAVSWYRKAAEQGHVRAQYSLGYMFQLGQGVPQSDQEAVDWYRKAVEQGDACAQNNMGFMCQSGRGVPQSNEEATKWYKKAAKQGNASAQYNLGCMYHNGLGVPQSDKKAIKWYRKAAETGEERAKLELATTAKLSKRFRRLMLPS